MASFFGFGQSAEISIGLDNGSKRKMACIRADDGYDQLPLFYDGEAVSGEILIQLKKQGQKLEHQGIRLELIGQIEVYYDRANQHDFICLNKDLAPSGELMTNTKFRFCFENVSKPYESYIGANVKCRYFLRATISRRLTDIVKEMDFVVHTLAQYPENETSLKMEVGIEDCLHIEFEYNRSRYHLKDVIVGKIYFLLVRIKIKFMEMAVIKRESVGSGPNVFHENETIAKYEIMDGAPVKGESIPIRLFLAGYDLTPTMRDIGKRFSVKYFLNLVLVDEDDRRYYKQQEITLWRKADRPIRKQSLEENSDSGSVASIATTNRLCKLSLQHQSTSVAGSETENDSNDAIERDDGSEKLVPVPRKRSDEDEIFQEVQIPVNGSGTSGISNDDEDSSDH